MMASRGMGAIAPSKMPKGVKKARRDDTDFTQYAEGGSTSRHFDLPDHYLEEVVYEICNMAGVNLRDDSAATYGAQSSERAKSEKISSPRYLGK